MVLEMISCNICYPPVISIFLLSCYKLVSIVSVSFGSSFCGGYSWQDGGLLLFLMRRGIPQPHSR